MSFNQDEYEAALIRILDMAKESHWYFHDRAVLLQLDVAKAYLWISSVIGAICMFLIKDVGLSPLSKILLSASIIFTCAGFLLSMLVLWGRGKSAVTPLLHPANLSKFIYDQCIDLDYPSSIYASLINGFNQANVENIATNNKRKAILRIAAPFLIFSFILLSGALLVNLLHV